jgi:hypothetical protein
MMSLGWEALRAGRLPETMTDAEAAGHNARVDAALGLFPPGEWQLWV